MAREPNLSFIPKKPLAKSPEAEKRPISLFAAISVAVLILVGGAYGGVLYYKQVVKSNIAEKQGQLEIFNQEFDKTIIQEAKSMENRINAVKRIINRHVTASPVFALLERVTLQSVQFTSFDYREQEGSLVLGLTGVAPGFASLAYQRDVFLAEVDALQRFEIIEFNLDDTGAVSFDAEAVISPGTVQYRADEDTDEEATIPEDTLLDSETSTSTEEALSS